MKATVNQIFAALTELESKGCHAVFFEYGNGRVRVRIFRGEAHEGKALYQRVIDPPREPAELDSLLELIETLQRRITTTVFQCYKREFVKGVKAGVWEPTRSVIEFGENATTAMKIDGTGYTIDDPDSGTQYFVDMTRTNETDNQ